VGYGGADAVGVGPLIRLHAWRSNVSGPLCAAFGNRTMTSAQNAQIFDQDAPMGSKPLRSDRL
jgi:hypothetical protein